MERKVATFRAYNSDCQRSKAKSKGKGKGEGRETELASSDQRLVAL